MIEQRNTSGCLVPVLLVILILLVIGQTYLIERTERTQRQIQERIQEQTRAHLFDKIYSGAHVRVREEAARAFIEVERERGATPNLSEADLSGSKLVAADLSGVDLSGTDLRGASLSGANLSGANLSGANLSFASFLLADFSDADLSGADLDPLEPADLSEFAKEAGLVDLINASLDNLSDADKMKIEIAAAFHTIRQEQVNSAKGDMKTRLPERVSRPEHWQDDTESTPREEAMEDRGRDD